MNIVVQKYGGSSVADSEKIMNVARKVIKKVKEGNKVVAVVSAMGKTTDNLIKLSKEITASPEPREMDMLLTTGEQVSASLLAMAINSLKVKSCSLNAFQAGILTTKNFTEARIKNFNSDKLDKYLKTNDVLVVTGFQGITEDDELTTLGRGGSDTSAVALAAALKAKCEIYSDVDGVYTVDPRLHPEAKKIKYITYDEMLEMASSGAKVLHSRCVEIAKKFGVVIYCASTFSDTEGSYVVDKVIDQPAVTGLSVMNNQTQVTISNLELDYTLVQKIFEDVSTEHLNVDMISIINTGERLNISFTVVEEKKKHLDTALKNILKNLKGWNIDYKSGFSKISVVGIGMKSATGVAARFFNALKNIPILLVTTSEIIISGLLEEKYKDKAVKALVKEFEL
ncbi:MAG: aspartate kinase [Candidatus Wallbacteria bacterium]